MQYGFETLKRPKLISLIHPQNKASIRVAEKIGETLETQETFKGVPVKIYKLDQQSWYLNQAS
jgi:RimJ/RimL family protein N-acetyltransferase